MIGDFGQDEAMGTELEAMWSRVIELLREALKVAVKPSGPESQVAFAKRAGVSRPVVNSFANGHKTPEPEGLGKIAEALGMRIADLTGLVDEGSIVGSVDAHGVVSFNGEPRMGRLALVTAIQDWEKPLPAGALLVVELAAQPVPNRWNVLRGEGGELLLMRATTSPVGVFLRPIGKRTREHYDPATHRLVGYVRYIQTEAD